MTADLNLHAVFPFTSAMVMAAGKGTRMQPLTRLTPKPLIRVHGRALLDYILDDLARLGVQEVVVNVHYLADQLREHLDHRQHKEQGPKTLISDETSLLLETGGGVKHALPHLRGHPYLPGDPLLIMNSDVVWAGGLVPILPAMAAAWDAEHMDVLLLLVPMSHVHGFDSPGDYFIDPDGRLTYRTDVVGSDNASGNALNNPGQLCAVAGVQITKRALFEGEPDVAFRSTKIWQEAAARGQLFGFVHTAPWFHIGTPEGLQMATQHWPIPTCPDSTPS